MTLFFEQIMHENTWENPRFNRLDDQQKLMYLFLLTNKRVNAFGVTLVEDVYWPSADPYRRYNGQTLDALEEAGVIAVGHDTDEVLSIEYLAKHVRWLGMKSRDHIYSPALRNVVAEYKQLLTSKYQRSLEQ